MSITARARVQAYAHIVATDGHAGLFARLDARALDDLASALATDGALDGLRVLHEALRVARPRSGGARQLDRDQLAALAALDRRLIRALLREPRVA